MEEDKQRHATTRRAREYDQRWNKTDRVIVIGGLDGNKTDAYLYEHEAVQLLERGYLIPGQRIMWRGRKYRVVGCEFWQQHLERAQ